MKLRVRSVWQGMVGIRDRYIRQAKESGEDLVIVYDGGSMTVPNEEIDSLIVSKSASPVPDKFSNEFHYLVYFRWLPTNCQLSLWGGEGNG